MQTASLGVIMFHNLRVDVLVGLYGLFSIPLLRGINGRLADVYGDSVGLDFMINLILLSAPIIGMGLTTPLIVHVAKHRLDDLGRVVGRLYSWNIAGAHWRCCHRPGAD